MYKVSLKGIVRNIKPVGQAHNLYTVGREIIV